MTGEQRCWPGGSLVIRWWSTALISSCKARTKPRFSTCDGGSASLFHLSASSRGEEGLVINSPGNEVSWRDAQDFRREIFHDLLSPFRISLSATTHLDAACLPGW